MSSLHAEFQLTVCSILFLYSFSLRDVKSMISTLLFDLSSSAIPFGLIQIFCVTNLITLEKPCLDIECCYTLNVKNNNVILYEFFIYKILRNGCFNGCIDPYMHIYCTYYTQTYCMRHATNILYICYIYSTSTMLINDY